MVKGQKVFAKIFTPQTKHGQCGWIASCTMWKIIVIEVLQIWDNQPYLLVASNQFWLTRTMVASQCSVSAFGCRSHITDLKNVVLRLAKVLDSAFQLDWNRKVDPCLAVQLPLAILSINLSLAMRIGDGSPDKNRGTKALFRSLHVNAKKP